MFKTAAFSTLFLTIAVLPGTSLGEAQPLEPTKQKPVLNSKAWWNDGWGFAGPGLYRERDLAKRTRLANLLHMAHVHAAAQGCREIEIVPQAIARLFAASGPLLPNELAFVGGRISDFKEWLTAKAGEEICEWAYENYGPNGAMRTGLVRSKTPRVREPETTSGLPPTRLPDPAPLPPRRPKNL
jgi:hypothetical protein